MEQVRTQEPVKNTIHNLIQTLSVKLDSASRYALYQEDATKDGMPECAELFKRFEGQEREMIGELVDHLRQRLNETGS